MRRQYDLVGLGTGAGDDAPVYQVLARPDFQVQALWLRAELDPSSAREPLKQALALCDVPDNDRLAWLRCQTENRLAALDGEDELGDLGGPHIGERQP